MNFQIYFKKPKVQIWPFTILVPVEVEVHTVPHFKAPVNAKVELWRLECGGTFIIQTSSLKIGFLVHKLSFVATEVAGTVHRSFTLIRKTLANPSQIFSYIIHLYCTILGPSLYFHFDEDIKVADMKWRGYIQWFCGWLMYEPTRICIQLLISNT